MSINMWIFVIIVYIVFKLLQSLEKLIYLIFVRSSIKFCKLFKCQSLQT